MRVVTPVRWSLAAAIFAAAVAACGASPHGTASPPGAVTVTTLKSSIAAAGATLCDLNSVNPNDQGGVAVINVFSFGSTGRCDAASTAGQGVLYVLQYAGSDDANYFLQLAEQNPRFSAGWQAGRIAIATGQGVPASIRRQVGTALTGKADAVFP